MKHDDIISILKFFQVIYTPFGLNRTNFREEIIVQTEKWYKIYATVVSIFLFSLASYFSYKDAELTLRLYGESLTMPFTTSFYYFTLVSIYFFMSYYGIYLEPNFKSKVYNHLIKIGEFLKIDEKVTCLDYKKKLFIYYVPYLIFKISFFTMEHVTWLEYNVWSRHIISFLIDCEILRFSIETNLVSRTLKIVSDKVKKINMKNNPKFIRSKSDEKFMNSLIHIHDKLLDIVNEINSCYSLKV